MRAHDRPPVRVGERMKLVIEGLTHDAQGIARVDGYALFVAGALPGEVIEATITKTNPTYGFARVETILETAPTRVEPPCPVFGRCGGCQIQHMTAAAQLAFKEGVVREAFTRLGGFADVPLRPIIGMGRPWRYRNKAQVPVRRVGGRLEVGFYALGSHDVVPIDDCPLEMTANARAMRAVRDVLRAEGLKPYDERTRAGLIRHIVVRTSRATGETMVVLVTNDRELPRRTAVVEGIRRALPDVVSVVQNVNPRRTNVIFGDETRVLYGKPAIEDRIGAFRFRISPRSFFQVNPEQTERLYETARDFAALTGRETVIDAYAGVGTIALYLAPQAARVIAVESVPDAVRDARQNASTNRISNAEFIVGAAEEVLKRWAEAGRSADVVVVDPPRKGLAPEVIEAILTVSPRRLVYVSCNPSTLARDARRLVDGGYRLSAVQPVDMFPQTVHVEAVALLERKAFEQRSERSVKKM
ncbi:MAG: 23S rRNA (uracil(1939)-C(5))-methyltransferase RlmD [Hydrogenibacillus sp.]|nr:23S rRNA (uracil(1939)-C(5))-methyltransferase RlmD [Hydrogenibacillus sp.]